MYKYSQFCQQCVGYKVLFKYCCHAGGGSSPASPMMATTPSSTSASSIGLRPHLVRMLKPNASHFKSHSRFIYVQSLPDIKPKSRTLPASKTSSKQLNGFAVSEFDYTYLIMVSYIIINL